MPEAPLSELMALRGGGAALLGPACGLLLWLLRWLRAGGAAAAAIAVAAAYLGGGWAPGTLVALTAALPGLAGVLSRNRTRGSTPGAAWVGSGLALPALVLLARPALPADAWVLGSATGALAGVAADAVRAVTEGLPGLPRRLHDLRPTTDRIGTPPLAALAGIGAALAVATSSWALRLLGPGDPALAAVAGVAAMVAAAALRAHGDDRAPAAPLPALVATVVGALGALGLVAFIP